MVCDFQQCGILTSVDSDEPVQPPCKLRSSKWCSVSTSLSNLRVASCELQVASWKLHVQGLQVAIYKLKISSFNSVQNRFLMLNNLGSYGNGSMQGER